jgi:DNA-3-methyladenine glycosylase I
VVRDGRTGATLRRVSGDLVTGADGRARCSWAGADPLYVGYHDDEWGVPLHEERALFELLTLELFQSGLAWITILRKREGFRSAFAGFDVERVAAFDDADVERLLLDAAIVRNRAKIEAAIANARATLALPDGLDALLWSFALPPRRDRPRTLAELPASTPESAALAKELKRRGFRFVGPTVAYAFMQSAGLVDDHLAGCYVARP